MKKLFYGLLAILTLAHLNVLAMDLPSKKIDETSPMIQSAGNNNNRQNRIINFANTIISNVVSMGCTPTEPDLALLLSVGLRLQDQHGGLMARKKKAPYYKNLALLIEYLVDVNRDPSLFKKQDWLNAKIADVKVSLFSLSSKTVDDQILKFVAIISSDMSANKHDAINAYYDLIDHILSNHPNLQ